MKNKSEITPLGDSVVVERLVEKYEGSIHIPDAAREVSPWSKVIALGAGKEGFKFTVKVGDIVLTPAPIGRVFERNGRNFMIIPEGEILATMEAAK